MQSACRQPRTSLLLSILKGVDDEEVRKIRIAQKVGKDDDDVGEVGPAIEIKLELPARSSASAVDDDEYEGQGRNSIALLKSQQTFQQTFQQSF